MERASRTPSASGTVAGRATGINLSTHGEGTLNRCLFGLDRNEVQKGPKREHAECGHGPKWDFFAGLSCRNVSRVRLCSHDLGRHFRLWGRGNRGR